MATVIALSNAKGGTGKSATAVNLAAFLGRTRPTLLVDLDPQGHCAESFALDSLVLSPTVYDVLFERCTPQAAIRPLREQLALLPSNRDLLLGEVELKDEFRREERLKEALSGLPYEFVVIDCPPSVGLLVVNALVIADLVIIPVSTPLALQSTYHLFEVMGAMAKRFKKSWTIRGLQTFYRAGVLESERVLDLLKQDLRGQVFDTRINLNTHISVAMSAGRPILDYPDSSGYTDYRRLTEEVLNVTGAQTKQETSGSRGGNRRARESRSTE